MSEKGISRNFTSGFFKNRGLKTNIRYFMYGFLIILGFNILSAYTADVRVLRNFDFSVAITPLIGLFLGIYGVLGCFISNVIASILLVVAMMHLGITEGYIDVGISLVVEFIYCCLPCILWYSIKLPNEDSVEFPRFDTTAHFVKYYLIMIVNLLLYITLTSVVSYFFFGEKVMRYHLSSFINYLDAVLLIGIPITIVISKLHHKTMTINERMVLAFLLICIIATAIGAFLIYHTTALSNPTLFSDYEAIITNSDPTTLPENYDEIIDSYYAFENWFDLALTAMFNSLIIIEIFMMNSMQKRVTIPIITLSDTLQKYGEQAEGSLDPQLIRQECAKYEEGLDEVSTLTSSCIEMADKIDQYTTNLQEITAREEKINTELEIASQIQQNMLPSEFPPFPERPEIELYASMKPARAVGGDLYDFYLIDDDHLALVIGDVTDKGVPAAMFMAVSKTLIQTYAKMYSSPAEILAHTNNQLKENNSALMFCTVWLGIIDLRNGHMVAANGGHEYPAVSRQNGQFTLFEDHHDIPIAIKENAVFKEYEIIMEPGDCIFQYTDGVSEASNAEGKFFTTGRLIEALNQQPDASCQQLTENVLHAITDYGEGCEQFDDITMLCFRYHGPVK